MAQISAAAEGLGLDAKRFRKMSTDRNSWAVTPFCAVRNADGTMHETFRVSPQRGVFGSLSKDDAERIARVPHLEALEAAARELKRDMLERAMIRTNPFTGTEYKSVSCGAGAWAGFCMALDDLTAKKKAQL